MLWLGVICFWLLDAGNNTSMEPYRAFISDRLPKSQLARGFLTQSMFTGAGAVLANLSLFVLQKVSALDKTAGNGVPYWMYVCFMIGTVCILLTVLTAMARTKELTPSDEELEEMRAAPKGLGSRRATSGTPSRRCRSPCTRSASSSSSSGTRCSSTGSSWRSASVRRCSTPRPSRAARPGTSAIAWSGLQNGAYNFVTMVSALFLVGFAQRIGAKRVHAAALGLAAVALIWLAHIHNQYLALVPMIGLGIFWASAVGIPYLMVASMVPAKRTGVYMGILNMMIVVPMLIETVTFGWIFKPPPGQQGLQRDHPRRRPDGHRRRGHAVGQPARRGRRVADRAAGQPAQHHRVRPGRGRFRRHPDQPVRRGPGRGGGAGRPGQAGRRHGVPGG